MTIRTLETTLPDLLTKSLGRNWRCVVRCGSAERVEDLNRRLWTFDDASFLPHGSADDGFAEHQPIYLTAGEETPNQPNLLFLIDSVSATPSEITNYERCCFLFDGRNDQAVSAARQQWRAVVEAAIPAVYWAEEAGGKWVKKAEKKPAEG